MFNHYIYKCMKKKLLNLYSPPEGCAKILLTMKLTVVLLFLTIMQANAALYSQTVRVDVKAENASLESVFEQIRRQSDLTFVYNLDDIVHVNGLTFDLRNSSVEEILALCLKDTGVTYELSDNIIVLKKARQQAPQARPVSGVVRDTGGRPLPGVAVVIKGTTVGTATDANGVFSLQRPSAGNAVLSFSFLGKKSIEVNYTGQQNLAVVMEDDAADIDEIVVTGYQKIERRSMTSSITTVDMERLEYVNQPNIDKLLQGQVAGMTVINSSGAPGAVPQIRIRGSATISGSTQPLWVVDGIILDDPVNVSMADLITNTNLISSGIGGVNVDDIESINVLKDAAATALYGTRAANGVIVITTKAGQTGKTRVRYNGSIFTSMRPKIGDAYMMNSKERIDVNMEMIRRGAFSSSSGKAGDYGNASDFEKLYLDVVDRKLTWNEFQGKVNELETVNTDWFRHLFRNAVTHRHNVDISGGNEFATYYLSGSLMDDQSTAKGVGQQTYTGTLRTIFKLRDNLRLDAKINVSARENDSFFALDSWENPYEWSIYTTRAHKAYDENGDYNHMYYNGLKYNFMENREKQWRKSSNFGFMANLSLEWDIIKNLQFRSTFSINKQNTKDINIATEESYYVRIRKKDFYYTDSNYYPVYYWTDGGWRDDKSVNSQSLTFTNQLSFMHVFNENNRMDVTAGNEIKTSKTLGIWNETYGYSDKLGHQQIPQWEVIKQAGRAYWREDLVRNAGISFYGVAGYTFMNRYTASINFRFDMSNGFGLKTNKVFNPVWAVGLNYQMKREKFLKDVEWLDYLTLRGSYGTQGNLSDKAFSDVIARFAAADGINKDIPLVISDPKNPGLKWEKIETSNAALEFSVLDHRISAVIEYYQRKTVDALSYKSVSQVTGFNTMTVNWASLRNRGWEFTLNTINVNTPDFRWTTNLNFGHNKNEVLSVENSPSYTTLTNMYRTEYASAAIVGKPLESLWSFHYAGLSEDGRAQFYNQKDELVTTGMSSIDGLVYSGTFVPPMQAGLTNTFTYKNLTLQALFVGSFGNVIRMRNLSATNSGYGFPDPTQNMSKEWVYRWREPGDEKHTDIPKLETNVWEDAISYPYPANSMMYDRSDLRTVKGDYVRLQNLSLSYDLRTEGLRRVGIQNIRFMLQGNNLYVWKNKNLKGQDPEASGQAMAYKPTNAVKTQVSFGNTFLPLPRSYSFSMYLQF